MRIAVTAAGPDPQSEIDRRFGRAPHHRYDTDGDNWTVLDNTSAATAAHGAGITAAQAVVRAGASVLLTGQCGPKAMDVLTEGGVRVIEGEEGTAAEAVRRFLGQ